MVEDIVKGLLRPEVRWFQGEGNPRQLTEKDILVVAPVQRSGRRSTRRLTEIEYRHVDKFQGQEAPVVIYSMTTSSPEDAPRGMEFLFSLNRLNVATSRAMSAVILVGSRGCLRRSAGRRGRCSWRMRCARFGRWRLRWMRAGFSRGCAAPRSFSFFLRLFPYEKTGKEDGPYLYVAR